MPSARNKRGKENQIGHYRLDSLLLEQTVSGLYLAVDEKTDNQVFLLTLQPDLPKSSDLGDRFLRRAETISQLEHEAIPPLLDFGLDGKRPYAVMDYFPGKFLAEQLETAAGGQADDQEQILAALNLVKQVADGLSVAHPSGLIHHDLRPENIYLNEAGQPLLVDLAVPPTPRTPLQDSAPPPHLDYQSPEQMAGKALSGRSNIFSLGVLLYRLLAGQQPALPTSEWDIFEHKGRAREVPLDKARPGLSDVTYAAVRDCLWQKEWSRFETVDAFVKTIDKAIKKESAPPAPPPPFWLLILSRLRQPGTLKFLVPAVIFLILLLVILMFVRGRGGRGQNVTPTPDSASVPVQIDTAEIINSEDAAIVEPTASPTSIPATNTATVRPSATQTAVPSEPTELPPTATPTDATTDTPTPEPTETPCVISPPFGWIRYQIQANDSLSALAQATGTTAERLLQVNCLDSILLSIGQTIWLPSSPIPAPTETPAVTNDTTPQPPSVPTSPPGPNPTAAPTQQPTPTAPPAPTSPRP